MKRPTKKRPAKRSGHPGVPLPETRMARDVIDAEELAQGFVPLPVAAAKTGWPKRSIEYWVKNLQKVAHKIIRRRMFVKLADVVEITSKHAKVRNDGYRAIQKRPKRGADAA